MAKMWQGKKFATRTHDGWDITDDRGFYMSVSPDNFMLIVDFLKKTGYDTVITSLEA